MKRALLWLLLLTGFAAAQQSTQAPTFTTTGASPCTNIFLGACLAPGTAPSLNQIGRSINYYKLSYQVIGGTLSACAVQIDSSPDGSTWTAGGVITSQTCTSNGASSVVNTAPNYIRINVTSFTVGSGSPTLYASMTGYVNNPTGGGGGVWGTITGTLSNQTDLQTALNAKANTSSLATVATSGLASDLTGILPHASLPPLVASDIAAAGTLSNNTTGTSASATTISTTFNPQQVFLGPPVGGSPTAGAPGLIPGNFIFGCSHPQTGTSYTIQASDQNCQVPYTATAAATITLPNPVANPAFACQATDTCFTTQITNPTSFPVTVVPQSSGSSNPLIDTQSSVTIQLNQSLQVTWEPVSGNWTSVRGTGIGTVANLTNNIIPVSVNGNLGNSLLSDNATTLQYTGTGGLLLSGPANIQGNLTVGGSVLFSGTLNFNTPIANSCSISGTGFTNICINASGLLSQSVNGGAVAPLGTVTSFSATSTVSPLFTTSVATASTTPAMTITLSNAAAYSVLNNNSNASAAPIYTSNIEINSAAFEGSSSGSMTISVNSTASTMNLGSSSATVSSAGALTVASCSGCGSSGGALSGLGNAVAANTLSNGANLQNWQWTLGAGGTYGLQISEITTAASGSNQALFEAQNLAASTAIPAYFNSQSTAASALVLNVPTSEANDILTANINSVAKAGIDHLGQTYSNIGFTVGGSGNSTYSGTANSVFVTFQGGLAGTTNVTQAGAAFVGGSSGSSGTAAKGGPTLLGGSGSYNSGAGTTNNLIGVTEVIQWGFKGTIATAGDVVSQTTTRTTYSDCATTPCTTPVGVALTTTYPIPIVMEGDAFVNSDNTAVIGDIVCLSTTTAGSVHDNGTTLCSAGQQVGIVIDVAGSYVVGSSATSGNGQAVQTVALSTSKPLVMLHWR